MELLKLLSMTLMLTQMHNYPESKQNLLHIIDGVDANIDAYNYHTHTHKKNVAQFR